MLDLIIKECPNLVLSPPLENLNHSTSHCEFNVQTYCLKSNKRTVLDYQTADGNALNEVLDSAPRGLGGRGSVHTLR